MADKRKNPTGITPRGVFEFPSLHEPDYGTDEYPAPNGRWKLRFRMKADDPKVQAWLKSLEPLHKAAIAMAEEKFKGLKAETRKKLKQVSVNDLYTEVLDQDTEEPTGDITMNFKMPYKIEAKKGKNAGKVFYKFPGIFDAKGQPMAKPGKDGEWKIKPPQIWGGTEGRIAYSIGVDGETGVPGYFVAGTGAAGLSLQLEAVRILELVQGGERSASSYGFDDDEDGYSHEHSDEQIEENKKDAQSSAGNASDDEDEDF